MRAAFASTCAFLALGCGRIGFAPSSGDDAPGASLHDAAHDGPGASTIAFVQGSEDAAGMVGNLSTTFLADITAGHLIVVGGSFDGAPTGYGVSDTMGNPYTNVSIGAAAPIVINLSYAIATASGPNTVTVTLGSAPASFIEVQAWEYAGLAASPFEDAAQASGTTLATDGVQTRALTVSATNELVFAWGMFSQTGQVGTGYVQRTNFDNNPSEELVATTPGAYTPTMTSGGANWSIVGVTFRGQ